MTLEAVILDPTLGRRVVEYVCNRFNVTEEEIKSKDRYRRLCHPRHIAAYLMRERGMELEEIGHELKRDHTTVIAAVKKIRKALAKSERLAAELDEMKRAIDS